MMNGRKGTLQMNPLRSVHTGRQCQSLHQLHIVSMVTLMLTQHRPTSSSKLGTALPSPIKKVALLLIIITCSN